MAIFSLVRPSNILCLDKRWLVEVYMKQDKQVKKAKQAALNEEHRQRAAGQFNLRNTSWLRRSIVCWITVWLFFCEKFTGHCYWGYLALGARSLKSEFACQVLFCKYLLPCKDNIYTKKTASSPSHLHLITFQICSLPQRIWFCLVHLISPDTELSLGLCLDYF